MRHAIGIRIAGLRVCYYFAHLTMLMPYVALAVRTCMEYTYGTLLDLQGDDVALTQELPFTFPFYCLNTSNTSISTNGLLTFSGPNAAYANQAIPNTAEPNAFIAPFWSDLVLEQRGIYTHATNSSFTVQWTNMGFYGSNFPLGTFQTKLHLNGTVQMNYQTLMGSAASFGSTATVGMENWEGTGGVQASYMTDLLYEGLQIQYDPVSTPSPSYARSMYNATKAAFLQLLDARNPRPVNLISPEYEGVESSPVRLKWDGSPNALFYKAYVASDAAFSQLVCNIQTNTLEATCASASGPRFWKVFACDSATCVESCSSAFTVVHAPPPPPSPNPPPPFPSPPPPSPSPPPPFPSPRDLSTSRMPSSA